MSGLAHLLLARGCTVSGCDTGVTTTLEQLREAGAAVHIGHDPRHVEHADTVVRSSAVAMTDPEVAEALRRGLPVLHKGTALASLMAGKLPVVVTGTHGKTTTTALLASALEHAETDPSYFVGAPSATAAATRHGDGTVFLAEADESDASFLSLSPHVALVTNVEADHLDNYGTVEAVHAVFARFLDRLDADGLLVCCVDDPGARNLAGRARERGLRVCTYGESFDADVRLHAFEPAGSGTFFEVLDRGRSRGGVRMAVPGRHNALNATGALATGLRMNLDMTVLRRGVERFAGVRRRFEYRGEVGGVRVFDSYAHHPTELTADLGAARSVAGTGRIVAVFQPHLYSRTRYFAAEFGAALAAADEVVVLDVYGAREAPDPEVTGAVVAAAVPSDPDRVRFVTETDTVPGIVSRLVDRGDVVLTLGAGDVTQLVRPVLAALQQADAPVGEGRC